jgi:anti-sigma B factor antagonist
MLSGELDIASTDELDRALREAQDSAHAVTLDLSRLTFMDCRSLSVLAAAAVRARASDDRFDVVRGPPHINRLFELTGMTGLL